MKNTLGKQSKTAKNKRPNFTSIHRIYLSKVSFQTEREIKIFFKNKNISSTNPY